MLIERLEKYYGLADDEETRFILDKLDGYSEADEQRLYEYIISNKNRRYGFPDVSFLSKVFSEIKPESQKKNKKYYWCVCDNCGSAYSYRLSLTGCPVCWNKGFECRSYKMVVSENKPPMKVIRYNKSTRIGNEKSCYDCEHNSLSFCGNFGNENYDCNKLGQCKCASCCIKAKRANESIAKESARPFVPVKRIEKIGEGA